MKASLGAFLVGSLYGAVQAQQTWRGHGILANIGLMVGCALVTTLILIVILSLNGCTKADSGIDLALDRPQWIRAVDAVARDRRYAISAVGS